MEKRKSLRWCRAGKMNEEGSDDLSDLLVSAFQQWDRGDGVGLDLRVWGKEPPIGIPSRQGRRVLYQVWGFFRRVSLEAWTHTLTSFPSMNLFFSQPRWKLN